MVSARRGNVSRAIGRPRTAPVRQTLLESSSHAYELAGNNSQTLAGQPHCRSDHHRVWSVASEARPRCVRYRTRARWPSGCDMFAPSEPAVARPSCRPLLSTRSFCSEVLPTIPSMHSSRMRARTGIRDDLRSTVESRSDPDRCPGCRQYQRVESRFWVSRNDKSTLH